MLTYKYVARDSATGAKIKAEVQADSQAAASKLIRGQGLTPLEITPSGGNTNGLSKFFNRVHAKDRVLFSRQLSTLINAGLPLVQSLRSVSAQTQNKHLKIVIDEIITDIEAGSAMAVSMAKHPDIFNSVYISLITAGEASGTLDKALERLADQQEKDADIASKVRGAMIYPLIVLFVMAVVVIFMLVKVLPQVKTLYDGIGNAVLPLPTRILLGASSLLIHFWWIFVILLAILVVFTTRWIKTLGGKQIVDKVKMRSWPLGNLFMKLYMARFCRTGTTLVASGVPLIQVLEITGRAINNVHIEGSIKNATEKVKTGKSLGESLDGDPNFLELVPNMIKIGEQSGSLEGMLSKAADYYEKELDNEIKAIQTTIEPVMMILMGIMAIIIVLAVLLPIYNLAGQANNIV